MKNSPSTESENKENKTKNLRRFLRFGLRTFIVLFCLSAVGVNYWRHSIAQRDALEVLQSCGAEFVYHHEMGEDFDYLADPWQRLVDESSIRKTLRSFLGSSLVDRVACVRMIEKSNFAPIRPSSGKRKYHQTEAWIALRTLNEMSSLEAVAVEANSDEQLEILSNFNQLRYLQIVSYAKEDLSLLARLPRLEAFEFATPTSDIDWIGELDKITTLHVRKVLPAPRLTVDVSFVSKLTQLERLEFRAMQLRNLESIGTLPNLIELGLVYTDVESVDPFADLNIEEFRLTNSAIVDANAILKMSSLRQVDLRGTLLGDSDVAELKNKIESANLAIEFVGTGVVTQE